MEYKSLLSQTNNNLMKTIDQWCKYEIGLLWVPVREPLFICIVKKYFHADIDFNVNILSVTLNKK